MKIKITNMLPQMQDVTIGKEYEVIKFDEYGYSIIDDVNEENYIEWRACEEVEEEIC